MTMSEAAFGFADEVGIASEDGFLLGFDLSDKGDALPEDFTAAVNGVNCIKYDFAQRTATRCYVDGDRVVPLSDMRRFMLKICFIAGDPVHRFLADAAENGKKIRYAYCDGMIDGFRCGVGIVRMTEIKKTDICGMEISFIIENG